MTDKLVIDCSLSEDDPDRVKEMDFTPQEKQQRQRDVAAFEARERADEQARLAKEAALTRIRQRAQTDEGYADLITALGLDD